MKQQHTVDGFLPTQTADQTSGLCWPQKQSARVVYGGEGNLVAPNFDRGDTIFDLNWEAVMTIDINAHLKCRCSSGLYKRELLDARGIFCTYVCDACEDGRRNEFNLEIFNDSSYKTDEPIDE